MPTIFGNLRKLAPFGSPGDAWGQFAGLPATAIRDLFDLLLLWQERASQRHALSQLDAHALKDIGLTRADAELEADKPFWRV